MHGVNGIKTHDILDFNSDCTEEIHIKEFDLIRMHRAYEFTFSINSSMQKEIEIMSSRIKLIPSFQVKVQITIYFMHELFLFQH